MAWHLVADYLGATQTILYTPLSPMSVNETEDTVIRCIITAPYVNSGPVSYTLSAEEVETLPTLSEEEQASLGATYEQCVNRLFKGIYGICRMNSLITKPILSISIYKYEAIRKCQL